MKRFMLVFWVGLLPFFMQAQVGKRPYGVTLITTPAGSNFGPSPSEQARKYKFDIPVSRDGDFSLELKEYRHGVHVTDEFGDRIISGRVNRGDRINFVQYLDFKSVKKFELFTHIGPAMWYKDKDTEKRFDYVQYEGNPNFEASGFCPLLLIYEDDEGGMQKKALSKLLKNGKLPDRYTPQSEALKKLPRFFIVLYRY